MSAPSLAYAAWSGVACWQLLTREGQQLALAALPARRSADVHEWGEAYVVCGGWGGPQPEEHGLLCGEAGLEVQPLPLTSVASPGGGKSAPVGQGARLRLGFRA